MRWPWFQYGLGNSIGTCRTRPKGSLPKRTSLQIVFRGPSYYFLVKKLSEPEAFLVCLPTVQGYHVSSKAASVSHILLVLVLHRGNRNDGQTGKGFRFPLLASLIIFLHLEWTKSVASSFSLDVDGFLSLCPSQEATRCIFSCTFIASVRAFPLGVSEWFRSTWARWSPI